ncbi:bcl-2-like protein 10 [Rousettus aegyptiacus]|uniref:Bcl-2-like protein 10 n=1 Tax=Rousettus aegyptiacus TaxID=9407 RepID=A0A7J8IG19_ROUAE|nr:bcl-2-like protein 10 [Rousettus aegyptiacus]KAF6483261.1 BCL2 like 10 [Rousettus aegyptiacus]
MADALRLRTACVLTDYLEYCARVPGSAPRPPSTPEAAVLRSVATHLRQRYQHVWSHYRGYRGNRIELVTQVAHETLHGSRSPTWGRVVALVTFAGTLLERPPRGHTLALKEREADVERDCQSLVALLCDWLTGQHGAWLQAQGGWDGFCHFFTPALMSWRRLLVQVILSYFTATILTYLWTKLS